MVYTVPVERARQKIGLLLRCTVSYRRLLFLSTRLPKRRRCLLQSIGLQLDRRRLCSVSKGSYRPPSCWPSARSFTGVLFLSLLLSSCSRYTFFEVNSPTRLLCSEYCCRYCPGGRREPYLSLSRAETT